MEANWTDPNGVLTFDAGWSEPVTIRLVVDPVQWKQAQPQILVHMGAGTVRIDETTVIDRTGFQIWGPTHRADIPPEAAVDGLVEIQVEPLATTHFRVAPSADVDAVHVGPLESVQLLESEIGRRDDEKPPNVGLELVLALLGVALLWLWWKRRDAMLVWFAVGILATSAVGLVQILLAAAVIPTVPGLPMWSTLAYGTMSASFMGFLARAWCPDQRWATIGLPVLMFTTHVVRAAIPHLWGPGSVEVLCFGAILVFGLWQRPRDAGPFLLGLAAWVLPNATHQLARIGAIDPSWQPVSALLAPWSTPLLVFAMVMLLIQRLIRNLEATERFVPREYLTAIGATDLSEARPGHRVTRTMTVLFTDIRGFTGLSERLGPERTAKAVDAVLGVQAVAVTEAGGFVDKYIGDAVMALFTHPADALRAAEACVREVDALNLDVGIGIGVHQGELRLGTVGTARRMSCTAIGDTVNLAARIEGLTRVFGNDILVTEQTARAAGVPYRKMDRVAVKGRAQPVVIVEPVEAPEGWDEAFLAWSEGRFSEAEKGFRPLHAGLADRCKKLHANPPSDWDGVTRMTTK